MNTSSKFIGFVVVFLLITSCNSPNSSTTPAATSFIPETGIDALPTLTSSLVVPAATTFTSIVLPTITPAIELTSTFDIPTATIEPTIQNPYVFAPQNTNCRLGPDVIYAAVGFLMMGETSEIVARNPQGTWLAINNLDAPGICYVSLTVVEVHGIESITLLTVFTPLPPPTLTSTLPPPLFTRTPRPTITYTPELPTAPSPDDPHVDVSPPSGPIPTTYELKIVDFDPGETVLTKIVCVCGGSHTIIDQFPVTMDVDGNFTTSWTSEIGDPVGGYYVQAVGGNGTNNAITEFAVE